MDFEKNIVEIEAKIEGLKLLAQDEDYATRVVIVEGSDDGNKGDVEEFTDFYKENHLVDIVDNVIVKGVYVLVPRQINVDYE